MWGHPIDSPESSGCYMPNLSWDWGIRVELSPLTSLYLCLGDVSHHRPYPSQFQVTGFRRRSCNPAMPDNNKAPTLPCSSNSALEKASWASSPALLWVPLCLPVRDSPGDHTLPQNCGCIAHISPAAPVHFSWDGLWPQQEPTPLGKRPESKHRQMLSSFCLLLEKCYPLPGWAAPSLQD